MSCLVRAAEARELNVELGTGIVPAASKWEYFNGSMADFAVYQNELPGASPASKRSPRNSRSAICMASGTETRTLPSKR